ncbi:hypothetical protein GEV33_003186 [Tenebrio molitor]|uniref:Uncharacterized protein n=1 Tax=Tenebrio molitor TaxID=7067 RepID=A0A8J6LFH9_TENMO|nr:hypothetical protein GEV33_003186 [Tenebrio molitor]
MPADAELNSVLIRRQEINDALDNGHEVKVSYRVVNIYTEFHEFSRKEIKQYESTFKKLHRVRKTRELREKISQGSCAAVIKVSRADKTFSLHSFEGKPCEVKAIGQHRLSVFTLTMIYLTHVLQKDVVTQI